MYPPPCLRTNLRFFGLKPTESSRLTLQDVLVSGKPAQLQRNVSSEGKALCIIRSVHRDWNLVDDPDAGSRYR